MKTHNTELFHKNFILNIFILNVVFFLNTKINSSIIEADTLEVMKFLLYLNISWIITQFGFFRSNIFTERHFISRFQRICNQNIVFILFASLSLFFITPETVQSSFIIYFCISYFVSLVVVNYLLYMYLRVKYKRGLRLKRTLILGFNVTGQLFQKLIESNPSLGYKFVGFACNELSIHKLVLGKPDNLSTLIHTYDIQTALIVKSLCSEDKIDEYSEVCEKSGVRVFFISGDHGFKNKIIRKEMINDFVLNNPTPLPLDNFWARVLKRSFDIVFSLMVLLIIMTWMFPLLAILIKLTSKGPVLFVQKRTGFNNSTFNCYKFRTMRVNEQADVLQATNHDNRITPIGDFLRKTNLDEFLQFVNVLLGHMSVVGPRPHMLKHTEQYSALIESYMMRHFVKPGITGWAQVNGLHGETDQLWKMEKRVEYDIYYMNNWTFWLDLKIIPMTLIRRKKFHRVVNIQKPALINETVNANQERYNVKGNTMNNF